MKYFTLLSLALLASASALRTQATKKDPTQGRYLQEVCKVNHDVATSPSEVTVHVEQFPGENAHFNITLDDPRYGGKTIADGWCIDWDRLIGTKDWSVDIYSAYSDKIPDAAVDKNNMLPNLAWLINNIAVGDTVDEVVQGVDCKGKVTWVDLQGGIWGLVDDVNGTADSDYVKFRQECVAQWVRDQAIANGGDYKIDCKDPNEQIPLVMVIDAGIVITNQTIIAEMNVHLIPGLCECGTPTAAPSKAPTSEPPTSKPPTTMTPTTETPTTKSPTTKAPTTKKPTPEPRRS
ncbi:expressed unknown protein [Seminavis robusta]|uniref:Uncharacterized protein n=1 Tax=Seminavis robusta TaxID=568900 RepID=A0A9N8EM23_9STRA|nr:expressed unknown protein [Seminavis robusta]|eukprot:Sro1313_g261910.1 n/a (291) ;mRNA; r:12711-13858